MCNDYFNDFFLGNDLEMMIKRYQSGNDNGSQFSVGTATPKALSSQAKMSAMAREFSTESYQKNLGLLNSPARTATPIGSPTPAPVMRMTGSGSKPSEDADRQEAMFARLANQLSQRMSGVLNNFQDQFGQRLDKQQEELSELRKNQPGM